MTWPEIVRKIAPKTSATDQAELWDCLYLTQADLNELFPFVREHATHGWIYPTICFAAHTGARRSEILRVLVSDVDFESMTVVLREKKRSRKQRTTRRVPLTPFLARVLKEWLNGHRAVRLSSATSAKSSGARSGAEPPVTRIRRIGRNRW